MALPDMGQYGVPPPDMLPPPGMGSLTGGPHGAGPTGMWSGANELAGMGSPGVPPGMPPPGPFPPEMGPPGIPSMPPPDHPPTSAPGIMPIDDYLGSLMLSPGGQTPNATSCVPLASVEKVPGAPRWRQRDAPKPGVPPSSSSRAGGIAALRDSFPAGYYYGPAPPGMLGIREKDEGA